MEHVVSVLLEFGASPYIEDKEREKISEKLDKLHEKVISKESKGRLLKRIDGVSGKLNFNVYDNFTIQSSEVLFQLKSKLLFLSPYLIPCL